MPLSVLNGLVLHLETASGLTTQSGTVTRWEDASASNIVLNASGDPTLVSGLTPAGLPAIAFDGEEDTLRAVLGLSALPTGSADRTVFFVVDYLGTNGRSSGVTYGTSTTNQTFGLVAGGTTGNYGVQGWGGQNDFDSGTNGISPGWAVQSVVLSDDVLSQYLDGDLIDTDTHTFNTTLTQLVLGAHIGGLAEGEMNIAAVLIYDRALNAVERADVETYLTNKYLTDDGMNDTPIAVGEILDAGIGVTTELDILGNDYDDAVLNGSAITILDGPDHGTIDSIDPVTGRVTYTHNGSSGSSDSFTYQLTDANGAVSDVATASLDIGTLPLSLDGFRDEAVVSRGDMTGGSPFFLPISMTFLPDNRMLLLSKDGEIRIVDPETGSNSIYMTINNIDSGQERGLLDITLDPDFENNGYFYLYYTPNNPENARIARFEHQENSGGLTSTGALNSEFTVWEDTDGYLACCHYGGGLDFGPDDKLWLTTSDKFQSTTPGEGAAGGNDIMLDPASSSGKIIRVNSDGTVPDGSDGWAANPWVDPNDGFNDYAWAYGLRNPFRARWDAEYGQFYIGEVGGNQQLIAHDDIHTSSLNQAGAFYGWPFYEGTPNTYVNGGASPEDPNDYPLPDNDLADAAAGDFYSAPIFSIDHQGQSTSITGGEVYRGDMFPEEWDGVYFYGDYTNDFIKYLVLDDTGTQVLGNFDFKPSAQLPGTTNEIVSLTVGEDGALYYVMIASGEVRRITFDSNAAPEIVATSLTPLTGDLPLVVTFTASITDAEGDAMTYRLNFGDGTIVNDVVAVDGIISVQHTYTIDGRYNVSLSVSDPGHTVLSSAFQIEAGDVNFAPVITDEQSDLAIGGAGTTEITFTATANDPDNDAMNYVWHFGDGNSATGVVGPTGEVTASHTYATEGSFEAFLEVTDGTDTTFSSNIEIQVGISDQVPVTGGLVLLLQSDIKIGLAAGNTVSAWLDGSGSGNNLFAQGDPQLVANATPTGQAALAFDGADDLLERVNSTDTIFNLPTGNADRTIFFVVDYLDTNGRSSGVTYGTSTTNQTFGLVADGSTGNYGVQGWGGQNDFDSGADGISPGWAVQSVVLNDDVLSQYLDGNLIDTDAHTFNTTLTKLVLGAHIKGAAEGEMNIAAVLIYDRALNESERVQVEDFLQTKYITDPNNIAPVAADDAVTFVEDTAIVGNVLADNGNGVDNDANGDTLSVSLLSDVSNGTLVLNADGTFSYTPDANYNDVDSFIYQLSDGKGGVDQATVNLTGTPVDDLADAVDDAYGTAVDTALVVTAATGVLSNDTDAEGDPFTASLLSDVSDGTLAFNTDGSFSYTPNSGFSGLDRFTYQVTGGDSATVTVTVGGPQGVPVTAGLVAAYESGENVSLGAGNTVSGWLDGSGRGNDLLAQGDPTLVANATPTGQSAIAFDGSGDLLERVNATDTLNGLSSGNADRTIFFVVDYLDTNGRSSGVTYGTSTTNQTFGLVADGSTGNYGVQGWGGQNDFDSGADGISPGWAVQSVVLNDDVLSQYLDGNLIDTDAHTFNTTLTKLVLGAHIKGAAEGEMNIAAVLIYDRALNESERVQVEDFLQTKYITDPNNIAPVAADDAVTFVEDTAIVGNVLADNGNGVDNDANGDTLSVSLLSDVSNGTLVLNADGTFSYTPDANYNDVDSFIYQLSDGKGGVDQATVNLTGTPVDDLADAVDDAYGTAVDTALVVTAATGVLSNDTDAEGDPFTASLLSDVSDGTLAFNTDGSFRYTPNSGFSGLDRFTYQVTGGDSATVTVTVGGPQGVPVTAGLVAAYESGENVSLGAGNTVSGWLDGSGRGNDLLAQGDPTLVANATPTGQSAIAFDGAGDLLERVNATNTLSGLSSGNADRTIFFVVDYLDHEGLSAGVAYGDGAQNETFGLVSSWNNETLSVQGYGGSNDFDSGINAVNPGWLVQSVVLDDDVFNHYLNGGLIDSGSHTFNTDLQRLVLGEEIRGKGETQIEIAAVLIYDRALDELEREQVENYLQLTYVDDTFIFG